jgi:cytochrome c1
MQGFAIAKQNCLRCHYMGQYGGTKSGQSWQSLSTWAREQPKFFERYVHNPQALEPRSHMEGFPDYDAATLSALTAYFRTFTEPGPTERKSAAQEHPHP